MSNEEVKSMYKSTCEICLLAEAMKNCPLCKFVQKKEKEVSNEEKE